MAVSRNIAYIFSAFSKYVFNNKSNIVAAELAFKPVSDATLAEVTRY